MKNIARKIRDKIYEGTAYEITLLLMDSNDWDTIEELYSYKDQTVTEFLDAMMLEMKHRDPTYSDHDRYGNRYYSIHYH